MMYSLNNVVCDSSSLISLSESCNLEALEFLRRKTGVSFLIPPGVQQEIIGHPLHVKQYWFSALRLKQLLSQNVLKVVSSPTLHQQTRHVLDLANKAFTVHGRRLKLIQEGEAECVALFSSCEAQAFLVDEKTTRLLLEAPEKLAKSMRMEYKSKVDVDDRRLNRLKKGLEGVPVIRSTELLAVAAEKGFYSGFAGDERDALSAALYALRGAGCSLSVRELAEYETL